VENTLDTHVPSVEILVKTLLVISSAVLATTQTALGQLIFCSHHPYLVGTAKRNAVWKVSPFQCVGL